MELSDNVQASYIKIIDSILATSDLNTISEKRIRRGLQDAVDYDITPQKAAIKVLIMQRFDIFAEQSEKQAESTPAVNGHSSNGQPDIPTIEPISPALSTSPQKRTPEPESVSDSGDKSPPKKKRRSNLVDADAIFAAKLQAEENLRARPTRGANSRKIAPVKKKKPATKSKTSKKVKAEDDSDLDAQDSESKKEVTRTGGFHKPLALSAPLSVLLGGEVTLSRPQAVKKVWQYIRENNLQDPADRRQIRCDDLMRAVFKQDRIHMFTMTKILNHNLYNLDE
ncbi:SWIB/MDM2 domain-containing protein [Histoplasma capsulatum var. duboisii H88]|uniref:SWIB/MDM2 domain-containing protein n=1 Tax=Ajellomyces capsulatus (strain H88) TaxID=544711 RepID=F0UTE3_AJEC8|nr:SWIB/MDM2 domain-containing protein [Histoplasma capsulatum var. duboisii H88]QSS54763.1 SWIB/MDM2 domain-containing protein [Histoplasma capsulatum var. duboisii H88]